MDIFAVLIVVIIGAVLLWRRRRPVDDPIPANAVIVDGSNVMHWGGDPSRTVLKGVIARITAQGMNPIVIFDASVGYRLGGEYMHGPEMAAMIGLPEQHVYVVQKGVVADEVILDMAQEHGLSVVSNDRYRDWSVRFPLVKKKGRMMRGSWKGGAVVWHKS